MKKTILDTIAAIIALSYATAHASEQTLELDLQDKTAPVIFYYFEELPKDVRFHILQSVHTKDLKTLRNVCQEWRQITQRRKLWIKIAQKINPDIDNEISDKSLDFLKGVLQEKLQVQIYPEIKSSDIVGIQDNGKVIVQNDSASVVLKHKTNIIRMPGHKTMWTTKFSNADGTIHAGTADIRNIEGSKYTQAFVTVDYIKAASISFDNVKMKFVSGRHNKAKLLPIPDNYDETIVTALSANGRIVAGKARANAQIWRYEDGKKLLDLEKTCLAPVTDYDTTGFYWSEDKGMHLLRPKGTVATCIECMNQDAYISGGWIRKPSDKIVTFDNKHEYTTAALFLDNKYLFVYHDWLSAINHPYAEICKFSHITKMSPNGNAQSGSYYSDSSTCTWSFFLSQ